MVLCTVNAFNICGSVHHHSINKTTNVMQLEANVFIIPGKALYMFQVLFAPIIRSILNCICSYWYNHVWVWCQIRAVKRCSGIGSVQHCAMIANHERGWPTLVVSSKQA